MAWATLADLEKDFNRDFSTLTNVDDDMVNSQLDKAKGLIIGYIGYTPSVINTDLWAIHLDVAGWYLMMMLLRMQINDYQPLRKTPLDDTMKEQLEKYVAKQDQDEADTVYMNKGITESPYNQTYEYWWW